MYNKKLARGDSHKDDHNRIRREEIPQKTENDTRLIETQDGIDR